MCTFNVNTKYLQGNPTQFVEFRGNSFISYNKTDGLTANAAVRIFAVSFHTCLNRRAHRYSVVLASKVLWAEYCTAKH